MKESSEDIVWKSMVIPIIEIEESNVCSGMVMKITYVTNTMYSQ